MNSIIFSKRAPIGSVAINKNVLCTNQGCLSCVPYHDICSDYFYYLFSVQSDTFNLFGAGTTFKEISLLSFNNLVFQCPPLDEQQAIADYLDQKCEEIDTLVAEKEKQVAKLQEYKKALIFECVTGKREVA